MQSAHEAETMSRTLCLRAALAMVAVISAGCGGTGSSAGTGGNKNVADRHKAVKFAECMRENGVSDSPDPHATGALTIDAVANGSSLDTNSAAFKPARALELAITASG
jgi:hypothetical protein